MSAPRIRRRRQERRGVLLLVVVSLLVLFTLLAMTFVMVSSRYKSTAMAETRAHRYDDNYDLLLHHSLLQVLRGTSNVESVLGTHSLLEDVYGNDSVRGTIGAFALGTNYYGDVAGTGAALFYLDVPLGGTSVFAQQSGYYNGRVLTMSSGVFSGRSTRIVGYAADISGGAGRLIMLPLPGMRGSTTGPGWSNGPAAGDAFLINGRAFAGAGPGFNPATGFNNAQDSHPNGARPYALLPFSPFPWVGTGNLYLNEVTDAQAYWAGTDGLPNTQDDRFHNNEDYDAPDHLNMLLAGRIWMNGGWHVALPSLVRPDLIRYWKERRGGMGNSIYFENNDGSPNPFFYASALRRIFPRPVNIPGGGNLGHAFFTGSNPNSATMLTALWTDSDSNGIIDAMETAPWDVDNDGDGRPDSVWVDLGFPVQTAPDGRRYKPLVAILVLDMDNRVSLNAHGTPIHAALPSGTAYNTIIQYTADYAGTNRTVFLPSGVGYSVGEINLGAVVPQPYPAGMTTINEFGRLLTGGYPIGAGGVPDISRPYIEGVFGEGSLETGGDARIPLAGRTPATAPLHNGPDSSAGTADDFWPDDRYPAGPVASVGTNNVSDFRGRYYAEGGLPSFATNLAAGNNGTPPDTAGADAVALDMHGFPRWYFNGFTLPYPGYGSGLPVGVADRAAVDLTRTHAQNQATGGGTAASIDRPFTPAEFESLLRFYDRDARSLPDRIRQLAPLLASSDLLRNLVTTESWDIPSAIVRIPEELRRQMTTGASPIPVPPTLHITDLIALRIIYTGGVAATDKTQINTIAASLLSPDLVSGVPMDINRALGNGIDDDGDNVVDDPDEYLTGETFWAGSAIGGTGVTGNPSNSTVAAQAYLARHYLARHLFVLMMALKDSGYVVPTTEAGLSNAQQQELTTRRIAQWAVNAVDFRDRDLIHTPFEYDVNPFNGWSVDGFVGFNPVTSAASVDDNDLTTYPERRLVWGLEEPDLQLTEVMAGHDRRSTDESTMGTVMASTDPHFDQKYLPRGWAFFELFSPQAKQVRPFRGDLYDANGRLDLGRMAPAAGSSPAYPVWRLAISYKTTGAAPNGARNDVATRVGNRPDSTSLQPEKFNFLSASHVPAGLQLPTTETENISIDRIVWFTKTAPGGTTVDKDRIYYNYGGTGNVVRLLPGNYAVVGTYRKYKTGPDNIINIGASTMSSIAQEIDLGSAASSLCNGATGPVVVSQMGGSKANYPVEGTDIQTPLGIPVAGNPAGTANETANGWDERIGLSVSEPLFSAASYYPKPDDTTNTTEVFHYTGASATSSTAEDQFMTPADEPFDHDSARPLGSDSQYQSGTYERFKTVFLQRLANPVAPWNPEPGQTGHDNTLPANPYITIDWMPIDLTVYNGEATGATADPDDAGGPSDRHGTRQRGQPRSGDSTFNFWKQPNWLAGNTQAPAGNLKSVNLDHTLGYLNQAFHQAAAPNDYYKTSNMPTGYNVADNLGTPMQPFPWLTWNNRPYATPLELLMVPASAPGRLQLEFDFRQGSSTNHYSDKAPAIGGATTFAPYSHLLNFFNSSNDLSSYNPANAAEARGNFYRLFDLVGMPSRYSGSQQMLNPLANWGTSPNNLPFIPPFNYLSSYREPGRINLNTILDVGQTWRAIANDVPNYTTYGQMVTGSRRGWGGAAGSSQTYLLGTTNCPTIFANPYRASMNYNTQPVAALKNRNQATTGTPVQRDGIESTLLRPLPIQSDMGAGAVADPMLAGQQVNAWDNTDRNPYFRYQLLSKVSNMTTTRSNVYGVWLTVGYFEVAENTPDAYHPDGLHLQGELGIDTGEVVRHRAFYLIDRTIPVGFERGRDHNVEQTILVRRIIE